MHLQPITRSTHDRVELTVTPDFQWDEKVRPGAPGAGLGLAGGAGGCVPLAHPSALFPSLVLGCAGPRFVGGLDSCGDVDKR